MVGDLCLHSMTSCTRALHSYRSHSLSSVISGCKAMERFLTALFARVWGSLDTCTVKTACTLVQLTMWSKQKLALTTLCMVLDN